MGKMKDELQCKIVCDVVGLNITDLEDDKEMDNKITDT